jgi:hypothetical protein
VPVGVLVIRPQWPSLHEPTEKIENAHYFDRCDAARYALAYLRYQQPSEWKPTDHLDNRSVLSGMPNPPKRKPAMAKGIAKATAQRSMAIGRSIGPSSA